MSTNGNDGGGAALNIAISGAIVELYAFGTCLTGMVVYGLTPLRV
jgi:hypothetical protein